MDLKEYIDFKGMFRYVKRMHLAEFPLEEDYVKYLKNNGRDYRYVHILYSFFVGEVEDNLSFSYPEEVDDYSLIGDLCIGNRCMDIEIFKRNPELCEEHGEGVGMSCIFTVDFNEELITNCEIIEYE